MTTTFKHSDQYLQDTDSGVFIQGIDRSDVLLTQFEVKDVDIFLETLLVRRLGNRYCIMLDLSYNSNNSMLKS
jgi:hypothetical protein